MSKRFYFAAGLSLLLGAPMLAKAAASHNGELPDLDVRRAVAHAAAAPSAAAGAAEATLKDRVPNVQIHRDAILGTPSWIASTTGMLSGPNGQGGALSPSFLQAQLADDAHRTVKAFVNEHAAVFGHDARALEAATVARDYRTAHNGLRTVVWEQTQDGVPVFEGLFMANLSSAGELVNVADRFVADPAAAARAGTPGHQALVAQPKISAEAAITIAAASLGANISEASLQRVAEPAGTKKLQKHQSEALTAPTSSHLVWLPVNSGAMRLCWQTLVWVRPQLNRYLFVVDAETGEVLVRRNLSRHISAATYNVYTSDSPSPFSPGWAAPNAGQPTNIARVRVTLSALDTNASPNGWINDSNRTTSGNNAAAFLDRDLDGIPDVSLPDGGSTRTFNFGLDLTKDPLTYANASTVQLFYRANWYHDRMYQLGFTEAAGNYQINNFNRGGADSDPVLCLVQAGADVGYTDNSMFQPAPDGQSGYCMMFVFDMTTPYRDGALDQEVVIHELTHGLSERLVGGGSMISELQTLGMGEGWSDFYSLCMLAEAGDDINGNYAEGGYVTYKFYGLTQNYYYGIRRYPYSTDMTKNPLTFRDIDPNQASAHSGIPVSPILGASTASADEVHNQGEVWCVALREVWASLAVKYGVTNGTQLVLQLVTDGMKLGPANPTFLQARDAILQADQVDTGGANYSEIWIAFAKRGMGYSAKSPTSDTTVGVAEAFDVPPDVSVGFPDAVLEVKVTPPDASALLAGDTNNIFVRVTDSVKVTNATIQATINGTNLVFKNDGVKPDSAALDSTYSAAYVVPTNVSTLTLTMVISAPGKDTCTNVVTYSVIYPPANDNFANAAKVPAAGAVYLSNNKRATIESGEPYHDNDASVAASLWWNYSPTSTGPVLVDAGGSDFIGVVAVYTNNVLTNLASVASATGTPRRKGPFVSFTAYAGINYHIAVAGANNAGVGTLRLHVLPNSIPDTNSPNLTISTPASGIVVTTNRVLLTGTCVDPNPNPTGIRDITLSVYSSTGVAVGEPTHAVIPPSLDGPVNTNWLALVGLVAGDDIVQVVATDFAGNISSVSSIRVTYRILDPPNDFFALATTLSTPVGTNGGTSLRATKEVGEPNHAGNVGGKSTWFNFTPTADGVLNLSTTNSSFDTLLAMYTGTNVANLSLVANNDDAYAGATGGFSQIIQGVRSNVTYHIALDGYDAAGGAFFLTWVFTPATLYHVTVGSTAGGTVPASTDVLSNSVIVLTAVPDATYQFDSWDGSMSSGSNPLSITVTRDLSLTAHFSPIVYTDGFESGDLHHLAWVTSGNVPWFVTNVAGATGQYAARSGVIGDGQTSTLSLTAVFHAGFGSFDLRVGSEPTFDMLSFYVNGVLMQSWSGDLTWTGYSFPVPAGTNTLRWTYSKDPSLSQGIDGAYIDNVSLPVGLGTNSSSHAQLQLVKLANGTFSVNLAGQTGQQYILQVSTNMVNWSNVATNLATSGSITIPDPTSLTQTKFYRALMVP